MLNLATLVQSLVIIDTKLIHIEDEYLAKMYNVYIMLSTAVHKMYTLYLSDSDLSHLNLI